MIREGRLNRPTRHNLLRVSITNFSRARRDLNTIRVRGFNRGSTVEGVSISFQFFKLRKPVAESGYVFKLISLFTSIVKLTCRRKKRSGKRKHRNERSKVLKKTLRLVGKIEILEKPVNICIKHCSYLSNSLLTTS